MSRGLPSMTALLALLAVAGYQNRDKIAEMLGGLGQPGPGTLPQDNRPQDNQPQIGQPQGGQASGNPPGGLGGLGGLLGGLAGALGGASAGSVLSGGLSDLVEQFKRNGQGAAAESWVGHGPNTEISPPQVEQAIGPDVLDTLTRQTGLSREEILSRLSRELPNAVDKYTPQGRIPTENEA
jgi:uncharacterized protein YidB (DUF937 family)